MNINVINPDGVVVDEQQQAAGTEVKDTVKPICYLPHTDGKNSKLRCMQDLYRHYREVHFSEVDYIACLTDGCKSTYHRGDRVKKHINTLHKDQTPVLERRQATFQFTCSCGTTFNNHKVFRHLPLLSHDQLQEHAVALRNVLQVAPFKTTEWVQDSRRVGANAATFGSTITVATTTVIGDANRVTKPKKARKPRRARGPVSRTLTPPTMAEQVPAPGLSELSTLSVPLSPAQASPASPADFLSLFDNPGPAGYAGPLPGLLDEEPEVDWWYNAYASSNAASSVSGYEVSPTPSDFFQPDPTEEFPTLFGGTGGQYGFTGAHEPVFSFNPETNMHDGMMETGSGEQMLAMAGTEPFNFDQELGDLNWLNQ